MTLPIVVYLGGPTGAGKSAVGMELAKRFSGEIVNADSQQVYQGLDIGTGKPTEADKHLVPHHLYDLVAPHEQLDVATWAAEAQRCIDEISARGRLPIVVGGTGLWMRTLYKGLVDAPPRDNAVRARLEREIAENGLAALHRKLARVDPESSVRVHPTDPVRIIRALEVFELSGVPLSELHRRHALGAPRQRALHLAFDWSVDELGKRLEKRVAGMFSDGLLEETSRLSQTPATRQKLEKVMGYREALQHLERKLTLAEATERIVREHRRYAKRQRTWLRSEAWWTWVPGNEASEQIPSLVETFLSGEASAR